jgi:branched-chain amino acid transport system permease protein
MIQLLKKNSIWILAGFVILVLPLVFSSGFAISLMGLMGIMIIFALAYNMLLGQGGMLSFGHAVYFGLAGYFTIHFINLMSEGVIGYFPVSLLPLFGGLVGLFFGVLIGFVSTRRAGTIFALISLGFVEMMTALAFILITFFNGEEGIQADRWVGPEPLGITFGPGIQVYYLIGIWCLISMIAMYALTKTPFGRMSNAVRDNPERAQFVGYNTQRVRWLAFSLSSFFAGLAGALFALHFEHVGYQASGLELSGEILLATYMGGASHFLGPIVGAILFTFLRGVLSDLSSAWYLYLGAVFLLTILFAPTGLAGLILRHEPVWKTDVRLLGKMVLPH